MRVEACIESALVVLSLAKAGGPAKNEINFRFALARARWAFANPYVSQQDVRESGWRSIPYTLYYLLAGC